MRTQLEKDIVARAGQLPNRLRKEHRSAQIAHPVTCVTFAPVDNRCRSCRRHHRNRRLSRVDVPKRFEQLVSQRIHLRAVRRIVDLHELKKGLLLLNRLADL